MGVNCIPTKPPSISDVLFVVEITDNAVYNEIFDDEIEFFIREAATLRLAFVGPADDGRGLLCNDVRVCGHVVVLRQMGAMERILSQCQENRLQLFCNKFRLDKRGETCVVRY